MRTSSALRPVESRPRAGFTLLELLAVVAVIAVLLALLLPAIMGAGNKARIVQVKTEIGGLTKSIADFKVAHGIEPPSFIRLFETASDWSSVDSDPVQQAIKVNSRTAISRMWQQFDFTINRDINNDGNTTGTFTLYGSECLVFFLGGVVDSSNQLNGFSKNPANPFDRTGSNREGPYYTFLPDRLVASTNVGFFGYADPIPGTQKPYLYANSNEGQGYNEDTAGSILTLGRDVALDFGTPPAMLYYYRQGTESPDLSMMMPSMPSRYSSPFWNKNGFQIISAGLDRKYGVGGTYQKGDLPIPKKLFDESVPSATYRDDERDNITNFSDGVLVP